MIWMLLPICFLSGAAAGFLAAVVRTPKLLADMSIEELRTLAARVAHLRRTP